MTAVVNGLKAKHVEMERQRKESGQSDGDARIDRFDRLTQQVLYLERKFDAWHNNKGNMEDSDRDKRRPSVNTEKKDTIEPSYKAPLVNGTRNDNKISKEDDSQTVNWATVTRKGISTLPSGHRA